MRFDAARVVALEMQRAQRLEIKFADDAGSELVVALPVPAAVELAKFISDALSFMTRLKQPPEPTSGK